MNFEMISEMGFSEILKLYKEAVLSGNESGIKYLEDYLNQHHAVTNATRLKAAVDELDIMDLEEITKANLTEIRACAADIADRLDPLHINSFAMIREIVENQIQISERRIKIYEPLPG